MPTASVNLLDEQQWMIGGAVPALEVLRTVRIDFLRHNMRTSDGSKSPSSSAAVGDAAALRSSKEVNARNQYLMEQVNKTGVL